MEINIARTLCAVGISPSVEDAAKIVEEYTLVCRIGERSYDVRDHAWVVEACNKDPQF